MGCNSWSPFSSRLQQPPGGHLPKHSRSSCSLTPGWHYRADLSYSTYYGLARYVVCIDLLECDHPEGSITPVYLHVLSSSHRAWYIVWVQMWSCWMNAHFVPRLFADSSSKLPAAEFIHWHVCGRHIICQMMWETLGISKWVGPASALREFTDPWGQRRGYTSIRTSCKISKQEFVGVEGKGNRVGHGSGCWADFYAVWKAEKNCMCFRNWEAPERLE